MCPRCTQLAKAEFEEFVSRDQAGVRFANRMRADGRFFDRHWPVFRRTPRNRWAVSIYHGPARIFSFVGSTDYYLLQRP
jgi:hypothetical protein